MRLLAVLLTAVFGLHMATAYVTIRSSVNNSPKCHDQVTGTIEFSGDNKPSTRSVIKKIHEGFIKSFYQILMNSGGNLDIDFSPKSLPCGSAGPKGKEHSGYHGTNPVKGSGEDPDHSHSVYIPTDYPIDNQIEGPYDASSGGHAHSHARVSGQEIGDEAEILYDPDSFPKVGVNDEALFEDHQIADHEEDQPDEIIEGASSTIYNPSHLPVGYESKGDHYHAKGSPDYKEDENDFHDPFKFIEEESVGLWLGDRAMPDEGDNEDEEDRKGQHTKYASKPYSSSYGKDSTHDFHEGAVYDNDDDDLGSADHETHSSGSTKELKDIFYETGCGRSCGKARGKHVPHRIAKRNLFQSVAERLRERIQEAISQSM